MFGACPDLEVLELHNSQVHGKIMVFSRLKKLKRLTLGVQSLRGGKTPPAIEGMSRQKAAHTTLVSSLTLDSVLERRHRHCV